MAKKVALEDILDNVSSCDASKNEEMSTVYPIKVYITRTKSRTLLFKTRLERDLIMKAILAEQGFENQLE